MKEIKIKMKRQGVLLETYGKWDESTGTILLNNVEYKVNELKYDVPINGTVYGTLLNYEGAYEQLENNMGELPYNEPPKAPILYIKPVNTLVGNDSFVEIPTDVKQLKVGPSLGIVMGKTATKIKEDEAYQYIKGYTIANDIQIPHESIYRPAIKEIARDGFCPIGPWIVSQNAIKNPNNLAIKVFVNNELKLKNSTAHFIRQIPKLLADVTEFMTLNEGDVLLTGVPENSPLVSVRDQVRIEIEGIGVLENQFYSRKSNAVNLED